MITGQIQYVVLQVDDEDTVIAVWGPFPNEEEATQWGGIPGRHGSYRTEALVLDCQRYDARTVVGLGDWKPTGWWRVIAPDGSLWSETSDEQEARRSMRPGDSLEQHEQIVFSRWQSRYVKPGATSHGGAS